MVPLQDKRIMASRGDTAVTTQPRSKRKEVETFVRELDPTQVVGEQIFSYRLQLFKKIFLLFVQFEFCIRDRYVVGNSTY